jgi:hypothetical protein
VAIFLTIEEIATTGKPHKHRGYFENECAGLLRK